MHPIINIINENWEGLPFDTDAETMMAKHDAILEDEDHPFHEYAAFTNFHMLSLLQSVDRLTSLLTEFASSEELSEKAKDLFEKESSS